MDAENSSCIDAEAQDIDLAQAKYPSQIITEISSSKMSSWGGARANSGGPRLNSGGSRPNSGGSRIGAGRKPNPITEPTPIVPMGIRWFVVETFPNQEQPAIYDACRDGWHTYMPMIATRVRDRTTTTMFHKVLVPMMRGYFFVHLDRDVDAWGLLRDNCRGIRGVLKDGTGKPGLIDTSFIEGLMASDADRLNLEPDRNEPRKKASPVIVTMGLSTLQGTVASCDGTTTKVDLQILGRVVPVEFPWSQVTAA